MRFKKIMILTIILACLLAVSTVSATGNATDDLINTDDASDVVGIEENHAIEQTEIEEIVGATDDGTFTALQNKIDNAAEGSTITLENDYKYNDGFSADGIKITKSLTIDGKGHTLNGLLKSRIFYMANDNFDYHKNTTYNVVLKNINIINGYSSKYGGSIYVESYYKGSYSVFDGYVIVGCVYNLTAINCNFTNNNASGGGAINVKKGHSTLINSNFILNNANSGYGGGAIFLSESKLSIEKCTFYKNSAENDIGCGGALYMDTGCSAVIKNSNFTNNVAKEGGAIQSSGASHSLSTDDITTFLEIIDSYFDVNIATGGSSYGGYDRGGAIYAGLTKLDIVGSIFNVNVAIFSGGGAIHVQQKCEVTINKSQFIKNSATSGGALCVYESKLNVYESKFANNGADKLGESICLDSDSNAIIKTSEFVDNDIFCADGCKLDSSDCKFICSTKINADAVTTVYNGGKYLIATLKDNNDKPLRGMSLSVNINGIKTFKTDRYGQIKVSLDGLVPNTYYAEITFNGNSNYTNSTIVARVTVEKAISIISSEDVTTVYNGGKYLIITLKDGLANPINGAVLSVNCDGVKTIGTDSNGQAKLTTNALVPKTYTVTITFAGNAKYDKSTKTVNVKVTKATPKLTAKAKTLKRSDKTKKYTVTLKTNQNKAMKNTKVTIKVNKKTYTAKTNSKGKATFKLTKLTKKGKYTATVRYAGSKYYNAKTVKPKIIVK